jgi:ribosomal protein S13
VVAPEAAPMPRMIVRTANVRITVADTGKAVDAVTRSVEGVGGYVSGSNVWREGELLRAKLTLRVPANQLTSALAAIRGLAKRVDNEVIASEDVSQEFVDLDARVRNLEATEEELRQLLVVARQNSRKATEVLEVHQQLMNIRGEIEQAKGRMRYLSQVTSMSTISLEVTPDAIAQPVVEPGWQPLVVAKNAVRALIGVMQSLANVVIWLLIYVVPLFALLALVIVPIWKMARRGRAGEA